MQGRIRVLSPRSTHSCVFSRHPRGFITPAFIPLSRAHRSCPRSRGTRRLVRVAEQRGSMSKSGLDRWSKCGASGEGNQGKEEMQEKREHEGWRKQTGRGTEGQLVCHFTAVTCLLCSSQGTFKCYTQTSWGKWCFSFNWIVWNGRSLFWFVLLRRMAEMQTTRQFDVLNWATFSFVHV